MTQANLTFYNVTDCGYYHRDSDLPAFGTLDGLLSDFLAWAKDGQKKLGDTCTYLPVETSGLLRTFCYDCMRDSYTGDVLLVTWNESSSHDGHVTHVREDDEVGSASVESTPLPPKSIPGHPTYFWFLPTKKAYATIRFESPLNGNEGMRKLLKEFAAKFSEHCVAGPNGGVGKIEILGYRQDPADTESTPLHLFPRFKSQLARKPGFTEYIVGSRARIRKIHRKNLVLQAARPDTDDSRTFADLFDRLEGGLPETGRNDVHVSYEIDVTPTETELMGIINAWTSRTRHDSRTKWEDVGFQLHGEGAKVHWLSSSLIKYEPQLDLSPDTNGGVTADLLFAELLRVRQQAIRSLNQRG